MGKVSSADKMRIQTLREQSYGAKAIMAVYPQSFWKLSAVKKICKRVDQTDSATERKAGSGRPKSARLDTNIARVEELICSQEGQSDQHFSTREIAAKLDISDRDQSVVLQRKISIVWIMLLLLYVCSNVFECARITRWHSCNANNFKTVFDN